MPLNTAGITAILADGEGTTVWAAIGDGDTAADVTSEQRRQLTLVAAAGELTATGPYAYTGEAAAGATDALLFSAEASGTFYGNVPLTGDATFNAAGEYNLPTLTIAGSSSDA